MKRSSPPTIQSASPQSNNPSNDSTSGESPVAAPSSVRRSGRQSQRAPPKPPAKKKKASTISSTDSPKKDNSAPPPTVPKITLRVNKEPIPKPALGETSLINLPHKSSPAITNDSKTTASTPFPTTPLPATHTTSDNSPPLSSTGAFYQPSTATRGTPHSPLLDNYSLLPTFTITQLLNLVHFHHHGNYNDNTRLPSPSLPAAAATMPVPLQDLKMLARAAAGHYAGLPRDLGNFEACLPHLYKTFLGTAEFEKWERDTRGALSEWDTHHVLMLVFEMIFLGRLNRAQAEMMIWGLLGFRDEEDCVGEEAKSSTKRGMNPPPQRCMNGFKLIPIASGRRRKAPTG
ncbi:hypothetical protein L873DRAFT_1935010 [Choiromyces venosus 120613-1]|uniref:Uncharacterized protein n=1 Tax=Choiromyces venosus 120613-1 TaxID=1336337 RepID=A0A3N4JLW8_9PEZI|nr:hypothetical protein L873DRAFT_1935010 [Choiromyces venosus 120613-1]